MKTCPHCGKPLATTPRQKAGSANGAKGGRTRLAPPGQRAFYFAITDTGWKRCKESTVITEGVIGKVYAASLSSANGLLRAGKYEVYSKSMR